MERQIPRRRVLGGIGVLATGGLLAGCSTETSGDTDTPEDGGSDGDGDGDGDGGSSQPDWPSYLDDANEDTYEDHTGEGEVTIAVENFYYEPTKITVDTGTTITWEFNTPGHNVKAESQPADDLEGTEGSDMQPVDQGTTHSEDLESTGVYAYFCGPHETQGMKGGIEVV
jgi:plastocyanin